jgi:hypothetical protein
MTKSSSPAWSAPAERGNNPAPAGRETAIGGEEITVALNGGALTVKKVRGGGAKVSGAEFAQEVNLQPGDRLE